MADIQGDQPSASAEPGTGRLWTIVAGLLTFAAILASVYIFLYPRLQGEPISETARLEIREAKLERYENYSEMKTPNGDTVWVSRELLLATSDVTTFRGYYDGDGIPALALNFTPDGEAKLREFSRKHVGDCLAVIVHDRLIACPEISAELGGRVQLVLGEMSRDDAEEVFARLTE